MCRIKWVTLQVALIDDAVPQLFAFSRAWICPRVVLYLSTDKLALLNLTFLVADGALTSGDFLVGPPVLHHLKVNTCTFLERNRASLDGTDCLNVSGSTHDRNLKPSLIGRLTKADKGEEKFRRSMNYFDVREAADEFPDPYLLDFMDNDS